MININKLRSTWAKTCFDSNEMMKLLTMRSLAETLSVKTNPYPSKVTENNY